MGNRIYRGPITGNEPQTINLPISTAAKPGVFVKSDGSELSVAGSADGTKRLLLLSNVDFKDQSPDDAYTADETAVAYRCRPDDEFMAMIGAGTYTHGQELSITNGGELGASSSNKAVVAYWDQAGATLTADTLVDVVIADRFIKA